MRLFTKLAVTLSAVIAFNVSAAKPQLDIDVSVNAADNGNVNATLSITNNGQWPTKNIRLVYRS